MMLLLGLLLFLALAVIGFVDTAFGEDTTVLSRCPSCGLPALSLRGDNRYVCARCGARYRKRFDGRLVPA